MAKETDHIPKLPSRILNSKKGPTTSAPAAKSTRGRTSQSSNHANPHRLSSPAQTSRGHVSDRRLPAATNSHKTASAAKKITAKEKRQAALVAAEENAARLNHSCDEEDEEEAEATDTQEGPRHLFRAANLQDTLDGDGHEDYEDEDESPEASRRPRLTRGLSVEDDEAADDLEDDGIAGLDNHDSDSDDPANSPTRHGRRKDKSSGIKFIPVGSTTTITSKLPAKKPNKRPISARQASDQSSEAVRSPARTGTVTTSSSPRSTRGTTSSPRTPRKAIINSSRPRMIDQTPATLGLLKAASADTRQELAVKDAFPERVIFTERCKATFLAACDDVQAVVQRQRFLKSDSYRIRMLNILRQKLSQMRQEVRNAALAKTAIHYGITSTMNPADIVELVHRLKTKLAYVFTDPDRKNAPYGNPIFQILINTLFFEGKRKSEAISNPAPWNPMPLPVLALTATAIHSVLDDWSTGRNEAAKNQFTHDKYAQVYRDHLANLARFNEKGPAAVAKLRTSLWENAWASTGCALPDDGHVYIDDDVFAEAEAEALA